MRTLRTFEIGKAEPGCVMSPKDCIVKPRKQKLQAPKGCETSEPLNLPTSGNYPNLRTSETWKAEPGCLTSPMECIIRDLGNRNSESPKAAKLPNLRTCQFPETTPNTHVSLRGTASLTQSPWGGRRINDTMINDTMIGDCLRSMPSIEHLMIDF